EHYPIGHSKGRALDDRIHRDHVGDMKPGARCRPLTGHSLREPSSLAPRPPIVDKRVDHGRVRARAAIERAREGVPMHLLMRGKYLLTSAAESCVLTDAAVLVTGDRVAEVGDWQTLREAHPEVRVVGNGRQLLLPGLIDAHSHGRSISPIQKGVLNDYLEN